jgi:hypothetical protein
MGDAVVARRRDAAMGLVRILEIGMARLQISTNVRVPSLEPSSLTTISSLSCGYVCARSDCRQSFSNRFRSYVNTTIEIVGSVMRSP